ncbi:hypothetical protein Tco_1228640 [Tanacetum coccineum]
MRSVLLAPIPNVWLSSPFCLPSRAAKAAAEWHLASSGCAGPPAGPCCPCTTVVGYDQLSSTLSSLQISYGLPSASLKSHGLYLLARSLASSSHPRPSGQSSLCLSDDVYMLCFFCLKQHIEPTSNSVYDSVHRLTCANLIRVLHNHCHKCCHMSTNSCVGGGAGDNTGEGGNSGSDGEGIWGSGEDHGESGGVDIARSLATSASDHIV